MNLVDLAGLLALVDCSTGLGRRILPGATGFPFLVTEDIQLLFEGTPHTT